MSAALSLQTVKSGTELTIAAAGRVDTMTAPALEKEIKDNIEGVTALVLDLKDMTYISSAGLRVLLSAQKMMNKQGTMSLTGTRAEVMEIFEVTGFADILTFA